MDADQDSGNGNTSSGKMGTPQGAALGVEGIEVFKDFNNSLRYSARVEGLSRRSDPGMPGTPYL